MSFCLNCYEDFRDDDTGGYNPACACRANCRSCCEGGNCERRSAESADARCDQCDRLWSVCTCDDEREPSSGSTEEG